MLRMGAPAASVASKLSFGVLSGLRPAVTEASVAAVTCERYHLAPGGSTTTAPNRPSTACPPSPSPPTFAPIEWMRYCPCLRAYQVYTFVSPEAASEEALLPTLAPSERPGPLT